MAETVALVESHRAQGHAVVIGLISTSEAAQKAAIEREAEGKAARKGGGDDEVCSLKHTAEMVVAAGIRYVTGLEKETSKGKGKGKAGPAAAASDDDDDCDSDDDDQAADGVGDGAGASGDGAVGDRHRRCQRLAG